jgi:hypothetical protein
MSEENFRDDGSRYEKPKFDWQFFGISMVAMVVIFGVIIGVLVSKNATLDTSSPATSPPNATNSTNSTNITLGCETSMKTFESKGLIITMSVASTVSAVEIEYAVNVFKRTYGAMLANELEQAKADYCDPYCRNITDVVVSFNTLTTPDARQASTDCDSSLSLTFSVEGTWYGCNDTAWPGLFIKDGSRRIRRNLRRILEELTDEEESSDSCPVCDEDNPNLGLVAPSISELKEVMNEFFTVIPTICELTDAVLVSPSA